MRTLVITPTAYGNRGDMLAQEEPHATATAAAGAFGMHDRLVMKGVRRVWDRWGYEMLDLVLLSEGLRLLRVDGVRIDDVGMERPGGEGVRPTFREQTSSLVRDFDLVFYLLSEGALSALRLPLDTPYQLEHVVMTSHESLDLLPEAPNVHAMVADGPVAAQRWHVKASHVRGFLFNRLCGQLVAHGQVLLEWLYERPQDTERLFYKRARWKPQWPLW